MVAVVCMAMAAVLVGSPDEAHADRGTVGLGVGMDLRLGAPATLGNISVPIHVSELIAVEPEIGFFQRTNELNDNKDSQLNLRFGLGLLFKQEITKNTNIYGGARFGIILDTLTQDDGNTETETSRTDFFIGGVAGGENFFGNAFSIGAEAGIYFISGGEPTVTVDGDEADKADNFANTLISTSTLIIFRWYFM